MTEAIGRDPGLQPERTALAWGRTILLFCANIFLLLRKTSIIQSQLGMVVLICGLITVAIVLWIFRMRRHQLISGHLFPVKALNDYCAKSLVFMVFGLGASTLTSLWLAING